MSMFWGLCMKPNRKYTQTIVKSFHVSGVALDEGKSAKLYITADKTKFIVATLNQNVPQMTLDLNFCKGDKIMFQTTGDAVVSLIGYLHDADESEDEFEDEEYEKVVNALKKGSKAAASEEDGSEEEEDEEEDVDDSKLAAEYSSFLEDESGEEEDEDDDEEGDDDDEEDDSEDDDDEEEEEAPKAKKAKVNEAAKAPAKEQNGVAKKQDKQQQQQQQKSKKDKQPAAAAEGKKEQPKAKEAKQGGGERTITGGVKIQDLQTGNGPEAKQGKKVSVYYIGRLKSNNKTFDSMQKGNGFKFSLGAGEVIKGWDVGVSGMKVGGKRRITCPAHMAYGARGSPPSIPPNSTLVFDVELKAVH